VNTISAKPGGGYQSMNGTSMATPHITGLAALLMEAAPTATIDQIEQAIFSSCSAAAIPPERGNRGLPNAVRALATLTGINLVSTTGGGTASAKKAAKKPATKKTKAAISKTAGKGSGKKRAGR
ncbi:MAG: S8 family serine peptidase, partial [Acidobacteriota bacterium]|nr:S8 family serine peptidase [Acidobacteriota bacterium]